MGDPFGRLRGGDPSFQKTKKTRMGDSFGRPKCEIFSFGRPERPERERSLPLEGQENQHERSFWKIARGRSFLLEDCKMEIPHLEDYSIGNMQVEDSMGMEGCFIGICCEHWR